MTKINSTSRSATLKHLAFLLPLLVIAVCFFYINTQMPSVGEDYSLEPWKYNAPPATLLSTIKAVSSRVIASVTIWSPRIGEAVTTIVAAFPPIVFDILNTLVLIVLVLILFTIVYGRFPDWNKPSDGFMLFAICFLIFILSPLLGQLFFWMSGACNHTWSLTLLLGFTLPFRFNHARRIKLDKPLLLILYIIYGFFAGITIENAAIVVLGFLLAYFFISFKQKRISYKFIYPLISLAIGVAYLIFSPVTTYRRAYYGSQGHEAGLSGIALYLTRFNRVIGDFFETTWPLLLVFIACFLIYYVILHQKRNAIPAHGVEDKTGQLSLPEMLVIYFVFFIPVLLMITIPYIDDQRRAFDLFWLINISCTAFLLTEIWKTISSHLMRTSFVVTLTGILALQLFNIGSVYVKFNRENNIRLEAIYSAIDRGQPEITLSPITIKNTRIIETRETLPDLGQRFASYFGFDRVTIQK
jgi:hypothetical protein